MNTLLDLRYKKFLKAEKGRPGGSSGKTGKKGQDVILQVPLGTVAYEHGPRRFLGEVVETGEQLVLAKGGKGGLGNTHFKSAINQSPDYAQPGESGDEIVVEIELKLIAEVGLVGFPNAGKSTLLSALSAARPKIADYPFTTLIPHLGVIVLDVGKTLTVADIPGLIKGASRGRGLGHRFLKHIERTGLLLHLIDITYAPRGGLLEDFDQVKEELATYSASLAQKPQMVLVNKMDLYTPKHRDVDKVINLLNQRGYKAFPISALTGWGVEAVKRALLKEFFHDGKSG